MIRSIPFFFFSVLALVTRFGAAALGIVTVVLECVEVCKMNQLMISLVCDTR